METQPIPTITRAFVLDEIFKINDMRLSVGAILAGRRQVLDILNLYNSKPVLQEVLDLPYPIQVAGVPMFLVDAENYFNVIPHVGSLMDGVEKPIAVSAA